MPYTSPQRDLIASGAVLVSGAGWGLFWLPARTFHSMGFNAQWLALWLFVISLAAVLPIALWQWRKIHAAGSSYLLTGMLTGPAFTLYTLSLVLTDVISALLLFYISPAWATLIGWATRGEPITQRRLVALGLAFAGLAIVLGVSGGIPWPRNGGDWLALIAGIMWAYGSSRSNDESDVTITAPVLAFTVGGLFAALLLALIPVGSMSVAPPAALVGEALPWIALLSIVGFVPTTYALLWSTQVLDPGRVGILLMSEVVVGTISAALLSGDPFGWREATGATFIIAAGFVEVTGGRKRPATA